jgi:hypothetical protein
MRVPAFFRSGRFAFVLYAAVLSLLLWSSWLRWPDAWVDFGYFLYHAWVTAEGGLPGRDFVYHYGPLALLFFSGLFKALGPGILWVYLANLLLLLTDLVLLHRILFRFSQATAISSVLVFLCVFALGQFIHQGNYNLLAPYKPEASVGLTLLLAGIWLVQRLEERATGRRWFLLGLITGSLLLTSTEMALAGCGLLAVSILSLPSRSALIAGAGVLLPSALSVAHLLLRGMGSDAIPVSFRALGILGESSLVFSPALTELMGFDSPLRRLGIAVQVALVTAAVAGAYHFAYSRLSGRLLFVLPGLLLLPAFIFAFDLLIPFWLLFPKALPFLPAALALAWLIRRRELLFLGAWSAVSLALLARMILNPMFHYYGFSLAFGATLLIFPFLLHFGPLWLERKGKSGLGLRVFGLSLCLALCLTALVIRQPFFSHKTFEVSSGIDPLFDWDPQVTARGPAMRELGEHLRERLRPGQTVLGLPDGHIMNYLLRVRRPGPFSLSLGEITGVGEAEILRSYREAAPSFVFLYEREFYDDRGGFGEAYGSLILDWLEGRYRETQSFGEGKIRLFEPKD